MNCTKEQSIKIVEQYWEREWNRIKLLDLPSRFEHEITEKSCINEFKSLCNNALKNGCRSSIIPKFYLSMTKANKGGYLSPVEFWEKLKVDKELFKKFYENRLRCSDWYKEKNGENMKYMLNGYVPDFIYSIGVTTSGMAPLVSYFKPATAKNILLKYAPECDTVIDCFSGYGGRLLGTLAAGKKYCGSDINDVTIFETNLLIEWLETNFTDIKNMAQVFCKDAFTTSGMADVFFSCPPYSKQVSKNKIIQIEEWESSNGKICCTRTTDEIIEYVLTNYNCKKYIFVVDSAASKYSDYVVEHLENINYFGARNGDISKSAAHNFESIIVITKEQRNNLINNKFITLK